jgi:GMP synthase-like glutamine amidotransferase
VDYTLNWPTSRVLMRIGIVNMDKDRIYINPLVDAVEGLGAIPHIINGTILSEQELLTTIQRSPIRHWIFSGSRYHIHHTGVPIVPMELFKTDKQFLMICYSMQSAMVQLGFPIQERYINRKGSFNLTVPKENQEHPLFKGILSPMRVWRDHKFYFPRTVLKAPVHLLASYNGEAMVATYKNAVLVQYHPEKTKDGRQLIENWLELT